MPLNKWSHVTITLNRNTKVFNLYVNGDLKKSSVSHQTNLDLFDPGLLPFKVGSGDNTKYFNGFLADIVILPQALNKEEIYKLKGIHVKPTHQLVSIGFVRRLCRDSVLTTCHTSFY